MIKKLAGLLPATDLRILKESIEIRFRDQSCSRCKEALICWEQKLLPEPDIRRLMEEVYGITFYKVEQPFITDDIKKVVKDLGNLIPLEMDIVNNIIHVGCLPEALGRQYLTSRGGYKYKEHPVTIYDYVRIHTQFYGPPAFLADYPIRDLFRYISSEAISLKASDITLAEKKSHAEVYYNINKRKVYSKRLMPKEKMLDLFQYITSASKAAVSFQNKGTVYLSIDLDEHHRGRVVCNHTYYGWTITIRVLSNRSLNLTLHDLHLPDEAVGFLRNSAVKQSPGLRVFGGPTMSGKNTTVLSGLYEYTNSHPCKVVSVEQPVEIIADFLEQINCDSDKEYEEACDSLLRQNPDIVYITEMTERTAQSTLKTANTGKSVFSTIHTNNVAEVISRIHDLTGMKYSQIIQVIHSVFFQQLLPKICPECNDAGCPNCHKAGMIPVVEYLEFTPTIKRELIGKDLSEIYNTIVSWMNGKQKEDVATKYLQEGLISRRTYETYIGGLK